MTHPLITQLRFTRSEFLRGLDGLSGEDAIRRVGPANSISWVVGHMAWHEQRYFVVFAQGADPVVPALVETFKYGGPASTPPLQEVLAHHAAVTAAVDPYLDTITTEVLESEVEVAGGTRVMGDLVQRVIYHYWFHNGENLGIRQAMGHTGLPQFVGDIDRLASFRRH